MADFITQVGGTKQPNATNAGGTQKTSSQGKTVSPAAPDSTKISEDQVILTEVTQKASNDPGFDPKKVEAIKAAIAEGNYPLDAKKIAESFSSLEKLIGNSSAN